MLNATGTMKLHFCFSTHLQAGFCVPRHSHDVLEIVYYLSGSGQTSLGSRTFTIAPNHFAIIPGGLLHDEAIVKPVRTVCVGLGDSGLEKHVGLHPDLGGGLRRLMEQMLLENRERKPGFDSMMTGIAFQARGQIERSQIENPNPRGKTHLVSKALAIIKETRGKVKVRQLADDLFVSEDYLSHLVRNQTRHSPIRHIIAERLAHAEQALCATDAPIAEIALQSGFESAHYFSRLFRKHHGQNPVSYRKIHSKKSLKKAE